MVWTDIELSKTLSDDALAAGFAATFNLPVEQVGVTSDMTELSPAELAALDSYGVLLERWDQPGDFPQHVMIILRNGQIKAWVGKEGSPSSEAMLQRLAQTLKAPFLDSDHELSDYTWLLYDIDGSVTPVTVDPDVLDNEDGFVIASDL